LTIIFEDYYLGDVCSKRIFSLLILLFVEKVTLDSKKMEENDKYDVIIYICRKSEFG
jgi:hypothetical protein